VGVVRSLSGRGSSVVATVEKYKFVMQYSAFWRFLGPENGQLLTGANPKSTAAGEGWVGKEVRGAEMQRARGLGAKVLLVVSRLWLTAMQLSSEFRQI